MTLKGSDDAYGNNHLFDAHTVFNLFVTIDNTPATQINRIITHPTAPILISGHEDRQIKFFDLKSGKRALTIGYSIGLVLMIVC